MESGFPYEALYLRKLRGLKMPVGALILSSRSMPAEQHQINMSDRAAGCSKWNSWTPKEFSSGVTQGVDYEKETPFSSVS